MVSENLNSLPWWIKGRVSEMKDFKAKAKRNEREIKKGIGEDGGCCGGCNT
ncbi:hypothetical protein L195_g056705, partial [Trifolium pratense]